MKLHFKQRFFSWLDSYDVFDENNQTVFSVKGQLSWGHLFNIYDKDGNKVGCLQQLLFRFLPHFQMYLNGNKIGQIIKKFTFLSNKFVLDYNGWNVEGDWLGWDYQIYDNGFLIASISKELWNLNDVYSIDVIKDEDAVIVLMIVLAIDAIKCKN